MDSLNFKVPPIGNSLSFSDPLAGDALDLKDPLRLTAASFVFDNPKFGGSFDFSGPTSEEALVDFANFNDPLDLNDPPGPSGDSLDFVGDSLFLKLLEDLTGESLVFITAIRDGKKHNF